MKHIESTKLFEEAKRYIPGGVDSPVRAFKAVGGTPSLNGDVRMVNSGTEACMSAIRLARGYTRKNKVIKFEGCYHGHTDGLLVKAGSGATTLGVPDSLGVPEDFARNTYTAIYNDLSSVEAIMEKERDRRLIMASPSDHHISNTPELPL